MSAEDRAAIRQASAEDARRSRTRQGLPERIEDPAAVAMLAAILRDIPAPRPPSRGGRTRFEWLDGEFFLIQRFTVDNPAAPSGIAIIGPGETAETFSQHYYDSRGVARIYQMSLNDGVWQLWREAPGFWQRYTGVFSGDSRTIKGAWEGSADGSQWKHDFELNYIKVG
jgi:hypothetical protein